MAANGKNFSVPASAKGWKVDAKNPLAIKTTAPATEDIRTAWKPAATGSTATVLARMTATSRENNFLGIFCGNGSDQVGMLFLGENGIYWNDTKTLLYGSKSAEKDAKIFTKKSVEIRIAWKPAGETAGGFYVWADDQLVGEALAGSSAPDVVQSFKDTLLVGDCGKAFAVDATIETIAFDAKNAWAPTAATPAAE